MKQLIKSGSTGKKVKMIECDCEAVFASNEYRISYDIEGYYMRDVCPWCGYEVIVRMTDEEAEENNA